VSDINDLIHTNARVAFDQGVKTELQRILNILTPYATHDEEMCYWENGQQVCYPEDCSAPLFQIVIAKIKGEQK
jgi:hypothetical protein